MAPLLRSITLATACVGWLASVAPGVAAVPAADALLPADTVGLLWLPSVPDFRARYEKTQLGELTADPKLDDFFDTLGDRLEKKLGGLEGRLGVTMRDFNDAASGQAAAAMLGVSSKRKVAAVVALVDATGRDQQAKDLLARIDARLVERGGAKVSAEGAPISVYRVPAQPDDDDQRERTVACFHQLNCVVASDSQSAAEAMLERLRRLPPADARLTASPRYTQTRRKARSAARGANETIVWYADPFGYDTAVRSMQPADSLPDKKDKVTLLREQGFDGVEAIGGVITVAADSRRDFIHHTFIYAPPKAGATGNKAAEKYEGSLQMFELPNTAQLAVEPWAPNKLASYKTIRLDLLNLFDHVGSLFSALAGYDNAFETTMEYFENDPYGPKINLRNDIVANLGDRVVVMTDYTQPITPESERYLMVFEVTDAEAIKEPLSKWMTNDGAELKAIDGVPYWEIVPEEELNGEIELDGLLPLDAELEERQREERVFRRAAVCLQNAQLVVASDVEFLEQALFGVQQGDALQNAIDLAVAQRELQRIAPSARCVWTFSRLDETFGNIYELIRQGKMPESQSFFGRFLNRLLTDEEQREVGAVREQRIDGSTLPPFDEVAQYFGYAARSGKTEQDGWTISGVILRR